MAEPFDPYRKWLGIPPSQQPPHHYRLLGIELYEEDAEVIDTAASQRMSYLQELGGGPYVKESQRLLNEVSAARRCLLDKQRKSEYDAELRSKLAAAAPKSPAVKSPPKPPPVQKASRRVVDDDDDTVTVNVHDLDITTTAGKRKTAATGKAPDVSKASATAKSTATAAAESRPAAPRRRSPYPLMIGLTVVIVGAAVALALVVMKRPSGEGEQAGLEEIVYDAAELAPQAVLPPRDAVKPRPPTPAVAAAPAAVAPPRKSTTDATTSAPPAGVSSSTPNFFPAAQVDEKPAVKTDDKPVESTPPTAVASAAVPAVPAAIPSATARTTEPAVVETSSVGSIFETSATLAAPDVRPHFVPNGVALRDLQGGFRDGDEYHLFYNATSVSSRSISATWGHAVSRDLFTWTKLKTITPPVDEKASPKIGKVYLDRENVSGYGQDGVAPWLAPYTYVPADGKSKIALGLAVSRDRGETWKAENAGLEIPDVGDTVRGPQLFRHRESKQWCLMYCTTPIPVIKKSSSSKSSRTRTTEVPATNVELALSYRLLTSSDLKQWEQRQEIPFHGVPADAELVELTDQKDPKQSKWAFLHAGGRFRIVDFDGAKVTSNSSVYTLQVGSGLAGFASLSDGDGKSAAVVSAFAAGDALAFPRRLSLSGDAIVPSAIPLPSGWLTSSAAVRQSNYVLAPETPLVPAIDGSAFQLQLIASGAAESELHIKVFGTPVNVQFQNKQLQIREQDPITLPTSDLQLTATVDLHLVELALNGVGTVAFKNDAGPGKNTPLEFQSVGGPVQIKSLLVTPLNPPKPATPAEPAK